MKKSKITNLDILGITPETENNIPSQITDLDDGATIIESITSLENNKQNNLSSEQLEAVNSGITAGKIMQSPYTTSEINPLVNQEFVNSSIATNTANFIGTFSNIVDLENYSGTLTNNDYAFVTNKVINNGNPFNSFNDMISYVTPIINYVVNYDYAFIINAGDNTKIDVYRYDISQSTIAERWGENNPVATAIDINDFQKNPAYNRYKYNGNTWEFEYTLNNSSFTAAQWAAINSGITNGNVEQIATNTTNITNLQNSKQDKLTAGTNITIDANNVINTKDVITLGTETQRLDGTKTLNLHSSLILNNPLSQGGYSSKFIQFVVDNGSAGNAGTKIIVCDGNVGNTAEYSGKKIKIWDKDYLFPTSKSGTFALTSDIPDVSTKANESIIADAYDNTQTYVVGDIVIYNNTLYRCITAIATAEDFDSTKWTAVTLEELIPTNAVTLGTETQTFEGSKNLVILSNNSLSNSLKIVNSESEYRFIELNPYCYHNNKYTPVIRLKSFPSSDSTMEIGVNYITTRYNKTIDIPNKSGTFALTSDIPTAMTNAEIDTIMDAILV